ncbi:MAG: hypothetical protein LLF89_08545 [Spirochaetaceae bacterium]|nr:hypothetical protein [Spirochaetaceae bacterium]
MKAITDTKSGTSVKTAAGIKASTKFLWAFCIANIAALIVVAIIVSTSV